MKKIGIGFLDEESYDKPLFEILEPIEFRKYRWSTENNCAYFSDSNEILFGENGVSDGESVYNIISGNDHFLIFVDISAFSKEKDFEYINHYKTFLNSNCEIYVNVTDSTDVFLLCKDPLLLERLYENAKNKGYKMLRYITEDEIISKHQNFFCKDYD